jgi:hypothetical protein
MKPMYVHIVHTYVCWWLFCSRIGQPFKQKNKAERDLHLFARVRPLLRCTVNNFKWRVYELSVYTSVADPPDGDPDLDPACHFDVDPDPTFHFDADPDLASKKRFKTLKKCFKKRIFPIYWLVIFKLMRIRIRILLITLMLMRTGSGSYLSIWCGSTTIAYTLMFQMGFSIHNAGNIWNGMTMTVLQ